MTIFHDLAITDNINIRQKRWNIFLHQLEDSFAIMRSLPKCWFTLLILQERQFYHWSIHEVQIISTMNNSHIFKFEWTWNLSTGLFLILLNVNCLIFTTERVNSCPFHGLTELTAFCENSVCKPLPFLYRGTTQELGKEKSLAWWKMVLTQPTGTIISEN